MLTITSFVAMGDIATKEAFDWVSNDPKMVRASSIVCRLMDDIVSHEVLITSFIPFYVVLYLLKGLAIKSSF